MKKIYSTELMGSLSTHSILHSHKKIKFRRNKLTNQFKF